MANGTSAFCRALELAASTKGYYKARGPKQELEKHLTLITALLCNGKVFLKRDLLPYHWRNLSLGLIVWWWPNSDNYHR